MRTASGKRHTLCFITRSSTCLLNCGQLRTMWVVEKEVEGVAIAWAKMLCRNKNTMRRRRANAQDNAC